MLELNHQIKSPVKKLEEKNKIELAQYPIENKNLAVQQFENEEVISQINQGIEQILSKSNEHEKLLLKNANMLLVNGEYELAKNLAAEILKLKPESREGFLYLGQCYLGIGDTKLAINCFKSMSDSKEDFQSLALIAEAYYSSGSDEEALNFYIRALEKLETESSLLFDVYKNIGNIFVRLGDFQAAEDNYQRAYAINPDSSTLLVNFGTLKVQKSHWEMAITYFRQAVFIEQKNDKAWVGLAISHREYGDHELAWANLLNALDFNALNSVALQLLEMWATKDGREQAAINFVKEKSETHKQSTELHLLLAKFLFQAERFKQCVVQLESMPIAEEKFNQTTEMLNQAKQEIKLRIKSY